VIVPEILEDETPESYGECLESLGLTANVITMDATDTTVASGAVVETDPEEGTVVAPQHQVAVAVNPDQDERSTKDPRCDVGGGGGAGDPGEPPPDGTGYPYYQLVEGSPYPAMVDPSGSSPPITEMPLRWGTVRWGWRKIRRKHPYTAADRVQTQAALTSGIPPIETPMTTTNQWDFLLLYPVDDGAGGTIECLRTVRVEYHVDPKAQAQGLTGIRGIFNSYTGRYTGGIPGH
jgi:hypothetical protein